MFLTIVLTFQWLGMSHEWCCLDSYFDYKADSGDINYVSN